ncbi:hypothetical protein SEVIR_4G167000v4 [Setaria viridis]|nr:pentatricopeptide repeat-containing protein At3g62890-like [Setaria italica]TKW21319.1 hypothetical protein SEVIR_4G167000v2 [Setaria viridis]
MKAPMHLGTTTSPPSSAAAAATTHKATIRSRRGHQGRVHRLHGFTFLRNSLLVGYLRHPFPADARTLFDEMLRRNPVSWSALISGSARLGALAEALALFAGMLRSTERGSWDHPDSFTLGALSTGCARARGNVAGAQVHACAAKFGVDEEDESVAAVAAKADMYAKCRWVDPLWWAFTLALRHTVVCWMWTSMIACLVNHGSSGNHGTAIALFKKKCWN